MSRYYTLREIEEQTGIPYITLWREVKRGELGAKIVAGTIRVPQESIDHYLETRPTVTIENE